MATHSQTAEEVLASSLEAKARGVRRALQQSRAEGVDRFVRLVSDSVSRLNAGAQLDDDQAFVIRVGVLHEAFLPLLYIRAGRTAQAVRLLAGSWRALTARSGAREPATRRSGSKPGARARRGRREGKAPEMRLEPVEVTESDTLLVELFTVAVADEMLNVSRAARGRQAIRRLLTTLR